MSNKRIGGDFSSLFDDNSMEESEGLRTLRISEIEPNKGQPRKVFDKEAMEQLAASIQQNGVLQPLLVRPLATGNYQIIAGERRWRAAKIAGLSEVPVVIRDDLSEEQVMQVALIENLQRENLNPIEEAQGYRELIDNYKMTQDQLAKALGKARSSIANSLGLLTLPIGVRDLLMDGRLSMGHCKALKAIKDKNPDCIPLYTNYAAGWTMGAWDDYISITATGDATYKNQKLAHTKDPFKNYGDDTHAYAVYKILYDAVSQGLTEDDYSTTDWESCKGMINNGEIGCMVLGSWAYPQMEAGGPNADDIGYIPFPISVNGKQYASSGADYCYGINVNASDDEKQAALVFVKWMTEKSGYAYNEDSLALVPGSESKISFDGVDFVADEAALEGEEDYLNQLNSESELNVSNGGNDKIQAIIEHAANGDMSFDDIMAEWNQKWSDAQESLGIEVTEK